MSINYLTKLSGLNWYKWGAIALVAVALAGGGYLIGHNNARVDCEQAKTKAADDRVVAITRYVTERVTEVQKVEVKSQKELKEIARLKKELDDATAKRQDLPECALSDDEFNRTNELLERIGQGR